MIASPRKIALLTACMTLAWLCPPSQAEDSIPQGELYLTLPFCIDKVMETRLDVRVAELKEAVDNEGSTGVCLSEISSLRPALRASSKEELDRIDAYLEFALAVASPRDVSQRTLQCLSAKRIASETAFLYFSAAALQKALEDSKGMLPEDEAAKLRRQFDDTLRSLLRTMRFQPTTGIHFDTESMDEAAATASADPETQETPEISVQTEDGRNTTFKLQNDFLSSSLAPGLLGGKRLWMIAGCKAAKNLLNPIASTADRALFRALAKLSRERLAKARLRDAKAIFLKEDEALAQAAANPPDKALASAIVRRDLALGAYCIALNATLDPSGEDTLLRYATSEIPDPKDEPPDPTLVEDNTKQNTEENSTQNEEGRK